MNGLSGLKVLANSNMTGVAQYFNLPTIGGLYESSQLDNVGKKNVFVTIIKNMFKIGVPIYPDTYEEIGGNTISEQVLVGGIGSDSSIDGMPGNDIAGALVKVADNIVVNPRRWRIHGYIGFNTNTKIGQLVNGFNIEVNLQSFIEKFGRETLNTTFKQVVQYISEARRPFKFNTREGETVPCLIKDYNFKTIAENANFVEIDLELQEFRFLALSGDEKGNQTTIGGVTSWFSPSKLGRTSLRTLSF